MPIVIIKAYASFLYRNECAIILWSIMWARTFQKRKLPATVTANHNDSFFNFFFQNVTSTFLRLTEEAGYELS